MGKLRCAGFRLPLRLAGILRLCVISDMRGFENLKICLWQLLDFVICHMQNMPIAPGCAAPGPCMI